MQAPGTTLLTGFYLDVAAGPDTVRTTKMQLGVVSGGKCNSTGNSAVYASKNVMLTVALIPSDATYTWSHGFCVGDHILVVSNVLDGKIATKAYIHLSAYFGGNTKNIAIGTGTTYDFNHPANDGTIQDTTNPIYYAPAAFIGISTSDQCVATEYIVTSITWYGVMSSASVGLTQIMPGGASSAFEKNSNGLVWASPPQQ